MKSSRSTEKDMSALDKDVEIEQEIAHKDHSTVKHGINNKKDETEVEDESDGSRSSKIA
jgi:hypothetical protein